MFAIYKILNHSSFFDSTNLELSQTISNLLDFKSRKHHINKYKLMMVGWCFIMNKGGDESFAEFLIIDIESEKIRRKDLLPIVRDLKLEKLLN